MYLGAAKSTWEAKTTSENIFPIIRDILLQRNGYFCDDFRPCTQNFAVEIADWQVKINRAKPLDSQLNFVSIESNESHKM